MLLISYCIWARCSSSIKSSRMSNRSKSWHRGQHFSGTSWKNIGSIFIEQSHPLGNSRKTLGRIPWTLETDKNTPPQIKNPESKGVKVLMLILLIAFFSVSSSVFDVSQVVVGWIIHQNHPSYQSLSDFRTKKLCQKLTDPIRTYLGRCGCPFPIGWDTNSLCGGEFYKCVTLVQPWSLPFKWCQSSGRNYHGNLRYPPKLPSPKEIRPY